MNPARVSIAGRSSLVLLMLCCLMAAQWLGLGHRIAHAGLQLAGSSAQAAHVIKAARVAADGAAEAERYTDPLHSCAAFDDPTLPAALATPPYMPPVLPGAAVLALWTAYASWQQPFHCHFSSRAPPRS